MSWSKFEELQIKSKLSRANIYSFIINQSLLQNCKMSSEEKGHIENKNKRPKKTEEDKELEALDIESTAGGSGGGGG